MERIAISPEPFIEKCKSLASAKNVHLDVVDGHVRLGWISDGSFDLMNRVEMIRLGISYEMLLDALSEAGGSANASGRYPLNDAIRQRLKVCHPDC